MRAAFDGLGPEPAVAGHEGRHPAREQQGLIAHVSRPIGRGIHPIGTD